MNEKIRRMLRIGESKLRILLLGFCVYSLIYASMLNIFSERADSILHNYIFIIVASIFSFCGGLVVNDEIEEIKKQIEWDWNAESKSDYICTEFVGLAWIGLFYFIVQMGIGMIFFPGLDQIKIGSGEHHLYPYLFTFNSIIIYIIYRLTIIKIEFIEPKHES